MSTRANIVIKDDDSELWFYRHSDGYPEGTLPTLKKFLRWVAEGKLRQNVTQAAGALILIGADEYNVSVTEDGLSRGGKFHSGIECGSYEPTEGQHGDVEYLYIIHLREMTIRVESLYGGDDETIYAKDLVDEIKVVGF